MIRKFAILKLFAGILFSLPNLPQGGHMDRMERKDLLQLAENIAGGIQLDASACRSLAALPQSHWFTLLAGAELIRESFFGNKIQLCTICNAKSGQCSEDCAFCTQSAAAKTSPPVYPLLQAEKLKQGACQAARGPISRYSIVTSGKRASRQEVTAIAGALDGIKEEGVDLCVSLGILDEQDFKILRDAGVSRYHHNLETAESHFDQICSTHTYRERVNTIMAARNAGLSVCAGGIFGVGETDAQVIELALALKDLNVDAVPVNFFIPAPGTRLGRFDPPAPLRCLKIIAMLRFVLPETDILICGGRENALKDLHPLIFQAGASGVMTNDYLTTAGRPLEEDLRLMERLGFITRKRGCREPSCQARQDGI